MSGGLDSSQKAKLQSFAINYGGMLAPLSSTKGIVFPYTPTIQLSHSANYGTYDITHSVYQQNYFINTPNPTINITATFTAQTKADAEYAAAAIHFCKVATKPEFGTGSRNPGVPPHVLRLSAYGSLHAANATVILRSFNYTLPEDVDYVSVNLGGSKQSIPAMFILSLDLVTQYPPSTVKNSWTLDGYKSGSALRRGFM